MNLVYGEVVDLLSESQMKMARVRIGGALRKVPIDLVTDVQCGDKLLLCDGIAIGKVRDDGHAKENYVSGNSR